MKISELGTLALSLSLWIGIPIVISGCDCSCDATKAERKVKAGDILQLRLTGEKVIAITSDARGGHCYVSGSEGTQARFPNGDIQCVLPFEVTFTEVETTVERNYSNLKEQK